MKKFGSWTEQTDTKFRTTGDSKIVTITPPATGTNDKTFTTPNNTVSDTLISRASTDTGTNRIQNKELSSNNVLFVDNADITKKLALDLTGITTGTTKTLAIPNVNGTLVIADAVQTLTNKTIDGDDNTVQDLALTSLKTTANLNVFLQRNGSGVVIDSAKAVPSGVVVGTTDSQTLTNKTLTSPIISTIVNTGTLTLPTSTDTLVGRATTDTLTNKTLTAPVIASIVNVGTLTLPTSTDTLVGRATTDTLTNKTIDADLNTITDIANASIKAGAAIAVNKLAALNDSRAVVTDVSGFLAASATSTTQLQYLSLATGTTGNTTTNLVFSSGPTLSSPVISTIVNTGTLTLPTSTDTLVGRATTDTLTNKTLTAPVIATIVNTGTLTLPTSTDTLVGRATTDTLTNKTISGASNTITNVSLTTGVTGTLPIANGGTNAVTAAAAFDNLSPLTTRGDLIYRNASNVTARLPVGTVGQVLYSDGTDVSWATPAGTGDVTAAANIADNALVRGDGGAKGIQQSGITVSDTDDLSGIASATITGDLTVDTSTFKVDSTNNRVGIGTASPSQQLHISSTAPRLALHDTDTVLGYTALTDDIGSFRLAFYDATHAFVSNDYLVDRNASGATQHTFRVGNNNRFVLTNSTSTFTNSAMTLGTVDTASFTIEKDSTTTNHDAIYGKSASATAGKTAAMYQFRYRGTLASPLIVNNGDLVGFWGNYAYDGTAIRHVASIAAYVDGTPGASDMPGRLVFNTTPDGSTTLTERMRITNGGQVLINHTTSRTSWFDSTYTPLLQLEGATSNTQRFASIVYNSADTGAGGLFLGKTRSAALAGTTIVTSGDDLGSINFFGADGVDMAEAATIIAQVDGTPGSNDMPGRLIFKTTADGSGVSTERMRINSAGRVVMGNNNAAASVTMPLHIEMTGTESGLRIKAAAAQQAAIYMNNTTTEWAMYTPISSSDLRLYNAGDRITFESTGKTTFYYNTTNNAALTLWNTNTSTPNSYLTWRNDYPSSPVFNMGLASDSTRSTLYIYNSAISGNTQTWWSDGNIGMGLADTAQPGARLHLAGTTSTSSSMIGQLTAASGVSRSNVTFRRRINALTAGTYLANGDSIGEVAFAGQSSTVDATTASILVNTNQTWSAGNRGSEMVFYVTPNATTTPGAMFRIAATSSTRNKIDIGAGAINAGPSSSSITIHSGVDYTYHFSTIGTSPSFYFAKSDSADHTKFWECFHGATIGGSGTATGGVWKVTASNSIEFYTVSDRRLKSNIEDYSETVLDKIEQVKLRSFDMKSDNSHVKLGVVAQELAPIFPDMVYQTDSGEGTELPEGTEAWNVSQGWDLVLVKAVQELIEENKQLKARITALENKG